MGQSPQQIAIAIQMKRQQKILDRHRNQRGQVEIHDIVTNQPVAVIKPRVITRKGRIFIVGKHPDLHHMVHQIPRRG